MFHEFAVDGHDGAAKTPILEGVAQRLRLQGYSVKTVALFHQANVLVSGGEIYPLWGSVDSTLWAIALLESLLLEAQTACLTHGDDILLYDRHWMTVMVELSRHPGLEARWTHFVPTFFVQASPEKTMVCDRFSFGLPWTSSIQQIEVYYRRYCDVADRFQDHIVGRYRVERKREALEPMIDEIVGIIHRSVARSGR